MLLPLLGAALILTLVVGFGLIYLPWLSTGFVFGSGGARSWRDAIYFSGVTLLRGHPETNESDSMRLSRSRISVA